MVAPVPVAATSPQRLKDLAPADVAGILARDPRLIVPVGTCEQHGPHLPLGCATIIAERLADDLSARFGVLRAPTIEYGVNVSAERDFAGNASLRKKTLHRVLNDLLGSWEASGVQEFILLTAHDHDPQQEAISTVITRRARVRVVDVFAVQIADLLTAQPEHMHGGEVDTSLLLYLAPELVHVQRAFDVPVTRETVRRYRRGALRVTPANGGTIGRPTLATAEKGQAIYDRILDRIAECIFVSPPPES